MRAPVSWLRELADVPAGATGADIAESLVKVGLEEEALHGGDIQGPLVVGRVLEVTPEKQKNGKTINWCQVDVGQNGQMLTEGTPQGIVCGASNLTFTGRSGWKSNASSGIQSVSRLVVISAGLATGQTQQAGPKFPRRSILWRSTRRRRVERRVNNPG